jgi:hypothetical protein
VIFSFHRAFHLFTPTVPTSFIFVLASQRVPRGLRVDSSPNTSASQNSDVPTHELMNMSCVSVYVCTPAVLRLARGPAAVTGSPPHLYVLLLRSCAIHRVFLIQSPTLSSCTRTCASRRGTHAVVIWLPGWREHRREEMCGLVCLF